MCDAMLIGITLIPDFCGQVDASHTMRPRAVVVENNDEVLRSGAEIPDVELVAGFESEHGVGRKGVPVRVVVMEIEQHDMSAAVLSLNDDVVLIG